jgi:hypothetical protein
MVVLVRASADFDYRETANEMLDVEWFGGDAEMTGEEYEAAQYRRSQLRPATGGRYFHQREVGTGYARALFVDSD